jgi:hypothetical protein
VKAARALVFVLGAALAHVACSGERAPLGITEPVRLKGAFFKSGDLPGTPPIAQDGGAAISPTVTSFDTASTIVQLGQTGKAIDGRTSVDAVAVGVRLTDLGTGYWVLPVDGPDPQSNGELTWQAQCDFGIDLPAGLHPLRVVAIDTNGHGGTQRELQICVTPAVPDNLNACDPSIAPPAEVISLSWDTLVDLDLVVVTPDGRTVDAKHPLTVLGDAGTAAVGAIDRDSNGACVIDGKNREDLVFQKRPSGSYLVYANLFDACGLDVVHFRLSLFEAQLQPDGKTQHLVETITKNGTLVAVEANGGTANGTFVAEIPF